MKVLPRPGMEVEPDFAAEQARDFAADGQAQAGAAVLAAGAAVGLLERLEDDLLLVRRDADAACRRPRRPRRGRPVEALVVVAPALVGRLDRQRDAAVVRELEGVGQQVLDDLLQPLRRRSAGTWAAAGPARRRSPRPWPRPRAGRCARRSCCRSETRSSPTSTTTVPDSILDRSRMSLMSMSRSLPDEWIVLANSVCLGDRLPSGFSDSWSERMSRLLSGVRSSCDMLARNSDLYFEVSASCLAFSSSAWRACSTSVFLLLDLLVLVGQQAGLLLQLLIGLLQLLLARLQLLGQRLRLLEQVLRAHVGLDRVEHDADALGQLVEERLVRRVEALERRQLQHALDLALEDDRQDDDVLRRRRRRGRTRCGCSPAGRWSAGFSVSPGALADQPFAQGEPAADGVLALVGVAGQELQTAADRWRRRGRRRRRAGRRRPAPARRG